MLAVLAVTVFGFGGPHGIAPSELSNANISVSRGGHMIASTHELGNMALRLRPGAYVVSATLSAGGSGCKAQSIQVRHSRRDVKVACSI